MHTPIAAPAFLKPCGKIETQGLWPSNTYCLATVYRESLSGIHTRLQGVPILSSIFIQMHLRSRLCRHISPTQTEGPDLIGLSMQEWMRQYGITTIVPKRKVYGPVASTKPSMGTVLSSGTQEVGLVSAPAEKSLPSKVALPAASSHYFSRQSVSIRYQDSSPKK